MILLTVGVTVGGTVVVGGTPHVVGVVKPGRGTVYVGTGIPVVVGGGGTSVVTSVVGLVRIDVDTYLLTEADTVRVTGILVMEIVHEIIVVVVVGGGIEVVV